MSGICVRCGNLYDLTPNIRLFEQKGGKAGKAGKAPYQIIDNLLSKINEGKTLDEADVKGITASDLFSYSKFSSLAKKKQGDILSQIKKMVPGFEKQDLEDSGTDSHPYYICYQCYYYVRVPDGEEIFTMSLIAEELDKNDYSHLVNDATYLRTKKYICANKKCPSHKNPDDKEALMTRNNNYNLRYVCTICKSSWLSQ